MSVFKVGDRVRIVGSEGRVISPGAEATVIGCGFCEDHRDLGSGFYYFLDVDGVGRYGSRGGPLAHPAEDLEPLTPPGQKEFKAEDILTMPNLPDFKTMTPEFARAWGGA